MEMLHEPACHYVVTPNQEIVEACRESGELRTVVNAADLVLPDGIGVIYGAKLLGTPLRGRVPGIEYAQALMARMGAEGRSLFLLGAKPGYAEQAAERLRETYHCGDQRRVLQGGCPGGGEDPPERGGGDIRLLGLA